MSNDEIIPVNVGAVLRRAIEVDRLPGETIGDEGFLDRRALSEIAAEIGVSPAAVATALANGQAGVLTRRTVVDRIVGPRWVWSSRTMATDDQLARERLVEWLSVTHGLRPRVRPDGVVVAQKRRDLAGKLGAGVRKVQGLGGLAAAKRVQAAAVAADDREIETSSLCLAVDVSAQRKDAIVGGSAAAVGMSAVIGAAALATGPVLLISMPLAVGVGTVVARRVHRTTVARMSESVDHTVDGVVQGDDPPGPLGGLILRRRST